MPSGRLLPFLQNIRFEECGVLHPAVAPARHCQADPNRKERSASVGQIAALRLLFLNRLDVRSRWHGETTANMAHTAM